MRTLILSGLVFFACCGTKSANRGNQFAQFFPDTTKGWAGRMSREEYHSTRRFEAQLKLKSISNGTIEQEIRVWTFSSNVDPQVLFIVKNDSGDRWHLRKISFNNSTGDSVYADNSWLIKNGVGDSLNLHRYWDLTSQSDMKDGDSYGCIDGGTVFVELADSLRYRCLWYNCPYINRDKDSAFLLINELRNKSGKIAVDY